ncbi:hypothetical protein ACQ86N_14715 [Puia sp. P3]|uniref:hypothetical protein n=1 Tax=Puia sp. P3 TaxID=3423952 RepID=UPI003D66F82E
MRDAPAAYQLSLDAFFLCWQRRADFTDDEKIKAFLYLTTRNACMDQLRRIADPAVTDKTVPAGAPRLIAARYPAGGLCLRLRRAEEVR